MPEYKTTKERSLDMAFLIGPENLKQLEELLAEVNGPQWTEVQYPVEYKVKFSDGSTVTYFSAREVSKQPNSDKRFIVSVVAGAEALRAGRRQVGVAVCGGTGAGRSRH